MFPGPPEPRRVAPKHDRGALVAAGVAAFLVLVVSIPFLFSSRTNPGSLVSRQLGPAPRGTPNALFAASPHGL
jgi:hypothetical protein